MSREVTTVHIGYFLLLRSR